MDLIALQVEVIVLKCYYNLFQAYPNLFLSFEISYLFKILILRLSTTN